MAIQVRLGLFCAVCDGQYREDARRLKAGAELECPHCGGCQTLDPDLTLHAIVLEKAREARDARRVRREELRAGWVIPAQTGPSTSYRLSRPVSLDRLDALLRQLDGIRAEA